MPHTLHLVAVDLDNGTPLRRVRAVREAMRTLAPGERIVADDAQEAIDAVLDGGVALLGESDDLDTVSQVAAALDPFGAATAIDYAEAVPTTAGIAALPGANRTPEEAFGNPPAEVDALTSTEGPAVADATDAAETERPVFSTEAYETAMVALTHSDGNPAKAAALCHALLRVTGDGDLYGESIQAICLVFPWVARMLVASGLADVDDD
jgi:hypothetical protein